MAITKDCAVVVIAIIWIGSMRFEDIQVRGIVNEVLSDI